MKDLGTQTIKTERLILRRFKIEDAEAMFNNWASDERVTKHLSWKPHKDITKTREVIQKWIDDYAKNEYNWAVELKDTGELIGNICVHSPSRSNNNGSIGYVYGYKYWRKGYATEALKAIIDYMLNKCDLHIIYAKHSSINGASGKVMEKAGMHKEAELFERFYYPENDSYSNCICYYIQRNE